MTTSWLRIIARSPLPESAALLGEGLLASGGSAVEERDGAVVSYLALTDRTAAEAEEHVRAAVRGVLGGDAVEFEFDEVPEEDWLALWRSGLEPRRMGRIVVAPTWSAVDAGGDDIVIRIDPQMAFGTGEHATTRGVLRLMQQAVEPGARVLDVGAGSAILAIAAARLGAASARAVENDPDAMDNAAENVQRNGVEEAVSLHCEHVDGAYLARMGDGAFDGILANVLSGVLRPLLPAFHRSLRPGGWAILSGILRDEARGMREAAVASGFIVEAEDAEDEWWSVLLRRPLSGHERT
ncbi:MAG TPA: 50S ribosomal protein L11 methyltransferase [Longimicrobiales bacterium]|nr:50S ribosomal protein L11 methyltransferase [Longimicrobiales bacterium]